MVYNFFNYSTSTNANTSTIKNKTSNKKINTTRKSFSRIFIFSLIFTFLLICYIYASNISMLPDSIILFYGQNLDLKTIYGISIEEKVSSVPGLISINTNTSIQASSSYSSDKNSKAGESVITLKLFNKIPIKDISVSVIPETKVIPLGNVVGLKLYTNGVLVVGMSEIDRH